MIEVNETVVVVFAVLVVVVSLLVGSVWRRSRGLYDIVTRMKIDLYESLVAGSVASLAHYSSVSTLYTELERLPNTLNFSASTLYDYSAERTDVADHELVYTVKLTYSPVDDDRVFKCVMRFRSKIGCEEEITYTVERDLYPSRRPRKFEFKPRVASDVGAVTS